MEPHLLKKKKKFKFYRREIDWKVAREHFICFLDERTQTELSAHGANALERHEQIARVFLAVDRLNHAVDKVGLVVLLSD